MAMGDDHTGECSTVCHQSDWAMVDAYMPVLSPAGVQEILDFGLYGYALSRFAGVWVGLKLMKDTVEVDRGRRRAARPDALRDADFAMPEGGLNIRLGDHWIAQEARLIDHKRFAAEAFCPRQPHRPARLGQARREDRLRRGGQELARPRCTPSAFSGSTRPRPNGWGSPPTRSARPGRWT